MAGGRYHGLLPLRTTSRSSTTGPHSPMSCWRQGESTASLRWGSSGECDAGRQAGSCLVSFLPLSRLTNYFLPLVMLPTSAAQTVSVGLQELITSSQLFNASAAAGLNVQLYMPELPSPPCCRCFRFWLCS